MNIRGPRDLVTFGATLALLVLEPLGIARAASPPQLYSVLKNQNRATEGPVRGDPGDVVLVPGTGFSVPWGDVVVYKAIGDTTQPPVQPSSIPTSQTPALGVISPLAEDANALTVLLPATMTAGQSYALWVVGPGGWSNPVLINDARPMWMLPGPLGPDHGNDPNPYVYSTAGRPGVGRTIKIFGRNLQPVPLQKTQVRFVDPNGVSYPGTVVGDSSDPSARYVVSVTLPPTLPLGAGVATSYTVELSRDATQKTGAHHPASWVPLAAPLTVLPDPPPGNFGPPSGGSCPTAHEPPFFFPDDYGCSPCDTADDTPCIMAAIAAAQQYSTALCAGDAPPTDVFGPGMVGCGGTVTWDQRASLCGPGYSPCTATQWVMTRGAAAPTQDYWTNDDLTGYSGAGSGACEAVGSGGSPCDANAPMRVCTTSGLPAGTDSFGNTCALVGCGLSTEQGQYFGGCTENPTAGTLCCANVANSVVFGGTCANGVTPTWRIADDPFDMFNAYDDSSAALWGIVVPPGVNLVADPCTSQPTIQTGQAFDEPFMDAYYNAVPLCSDNGGAAPCCSGTPDVTPCAQDSDCCPSGVPEVCLLAPGGAQCQGSGTACTSGAQCCSATCTSGTCAQCQGPGAACTSGAQCCSAHCNGGLCAQCQAAGTACTNDSQCCSAGCNDGICAAGASQCQAAGTACTDDLQCCSASCSTPEPCVTSLGRCQVTGAACASDADCGELCAPGKCEYRKPDNWQCLFRFEGANVVQGLHIQDTYSLPFKTIPRIAQRPQSRAVPGVLSVLVDGNDVAFVDNFFDDTYLGIATPVDVPLWDNLFGNSGLVIMGNKFGSYYTGVILAGMAVDTMIDDNLFLPGAKVDPAALGVLASRRLDVSGNTLDGTDTTYSGSLLGFRDGFFFASSAPQEYVEVSNNKISCVGTRPYQDGEAIATDSNGDLTVFRSGEPVLSADASDVTLPWPDTATPVFVASPGALVSRWLQVSAGPGLGQARRISSVSTTTSTITLSVSPPFDVVPTTASLVLAGNVAWQMHIVNNTVDDSCSASPSVDLTVLHPSNGGLISFYGGAADSVIDDNTQIDTAGIDIDSEYDDWTGSSQLAYHTNKYFIDIRGNSISNEFGGYENALNRYGSGIDLISISGVLVDGVARANPDFPGFGVTVANNTLTGAALTALGQGYQSAGIAIAPVQFGDQSRSPGYLDTLVFANALTGTSSTAVGSFPLTSAISNGATGPMPNYPVNTVICDNQHTSFPSHEDSDWPGAGETSSLILCSAGCAGGAATDVFGSGMVGCGGIVHWRARGVLCGSGYVPCTAAQWNAYRGTVAPTQNYWTADELTGYLGASGACEALENGGTSCGADNPMRVCTPSGTDSFGNTCARIDCGLGTYANQYFGGCRQNPTAGTLCCLAQ